MSICLMSELFFLTGVTAEVSGGRKLTKFVAYHVFRYKNRDERFAVVHCDGFADHVGDDHRSAAPRFDHLLAVALFCFGDFFQQCVVDVRAFFE